MSVSYSLEESDFINKVKSDLTVFVERASAYSVLVFPPVNSFFRFLIHQLAQENFDQLRTFSIGEDPDRRIVVCTKDLIERVDKDKDDTASYVKAAEQACTSVTTMVVSNDEKPSCIQVKKTRPSLPTIGIYRPPAARKSETSSVSSPVVSLDVATKEACAATKQRARIRRPDQQVYVPRAKRVLDAVEKQDDDVSNSLLLNEPGRSPANLIIGDKKTSKRRSMSPSAAPASLPSRASQLVETKKKLCQSTSLSDLDWETDENNIQSEIDVTSSTMNVSSQPVNLPPRAEVLVEKKKKLCMNSAIEKDEWEPEANKCSAPSSEVLRNSEEVTRVLCSVSAGENSCRTVVVAADNNCVKVNTGSTSVISDEVTNAGVEKCDTLNSKNDACKKEDNFYSVTETKGFDTVSNSSSAVMPLSTLECNNEVDLSDDDFHDALSKSKPGSFPDMLDVSSGSNESLSSGDSVNLPVSPVQLIKPVKAETSKKPSSSKCDRVFNPDVCDWDALLDEDGEVLDPFLMKELTTAVGEVQINQPQSDYRSYRSQVPPDHQKTRKSVGDDDFNHVVEIYSFPKEFKTNDLVAVFSPFKNTGGGFEIKWVDDTRALGVFASALVAEQVLEYYHPMVRTRPLCDASVESRLKARRLSESIQSFRPRPETCAALARRLVTGALGVKLATARQEREEEKRVLREAREKRRLAAKQRDDIWNNG